MNSSDERATAIEAAARLLLCTGFGPLDYDGIRWSVERAGLTTGDDAIPYARRVIDCALEIFDSEIAPFVTFASPPENSCYARCSPKGRCSKSFGYGVSVEHSFSGNRWIADGREYATRRMAEREARRTVLLARLRSELQAKPEFHRRRMRTSA